MRDHRFAAFLVITFAVTWGLWGAVLAIEVPQRVLVQAVGGLGPLIGAATVAWIAGEFDRWADQLGRWRVAPRWWGFVVGFPVGLFLLVGAIHVALGGEVALERLPPVAALAPILAATFLRGGLEEPGWRGMALPVLQERYGATASSLVVAAVWTAWHLPLFVTSGTNQVGSSLVVYGLSLVPLTVLFTVLYNNSGGSVLLAMVLHTLWNGFQGWFGVTLGGTAAVSPNLVLLVVLWLAAGVAVAVYGAADLADARVTLIPRVGAE